VYVGLSGTGGRTKEGWISIPIQGELQLSVIGEILDSADSLEEER
jgi:hypothetical protein